MMRSIRQFDPESFLATVGEGRTICTFGPNEIVYSQGDPAEGVFYTLQGKIKVTALSDSGKQAVLALLGAGEFVGHNILAGATRRTSSITTITDCSLTRLDRTVMEHMLQLEPKFSEFFIAFLLRRAKRMQDDVVDLLFNSSEKRLARVLLLLADFGQDESSEAVIPQISQEMLADMIGTTRPRVSFFMNKFRRLGFIDYDGDGVRLRRSLASILRN